MKIADRQIGPDQPVFVIAEGGINHNGDVKRAHALIRAAADAQADAVKFQAFSADRLISRGSDYDQLKSCELSEAALQELQADAQDRGLIFLVTPFDVEWLSRLVKMNVPAIKIGSGEMTNMTLLDAARASALPVILSTGMSTEQEIFDSVSRLRPGLVALLHCVTAYPAMPGELNLLVILRMCQIFSLPIGFSDHSLRWTATIAAVALGATIIEKHLTEGRWLPGPDHATSLEPHEFKFMVQDIRETERMLGSSEKRPCPRELTYRDAVRNRWTPSGA